MKHIDIAKRETVERAAPAASLSEMPHGSQVMTANRLFMGDDCADCKTLARELERKRYGYYQQDLRKKRVATIEEVLTLNELEEKIVASKLRCFYCARAVQLFYREARDPSQWTLDRIDNTCAHTASNTCIACLECNLQRRRTSHAGYVFTKNLSIRKLE
jgi:hypothetical protein